MKEHLLRKLRARNLVKTVRVQKLIRIDQDGNEESIVVENIKSPLTNLADWIMTREMKININRYYYFTEKALLKRTIKRRKGFYVWKSNWKSERAIVYTTEILP